MRQNKISIIIPSYNSGPTVEYTLKALDSQTRKDLISEIIVVDSSDDEETKRILSGHESSHIRVVDAGVKVMPAIGRNIGAREAKGEILAFLDADAYPARDWLENVLEACEKGYRVGGGCIDLPDFQKNRPIALAQFYLQFNEYMCSGGDRIKNFVPSCNMFCDRELFQQVGGFPEIRAAEDVLFGLKINKTSQLWFLPKAKVYHIFREDWKGFLKNQKLIGKYVSIYRKKYYDSFIYKGIMPLILFPVFLCIKLFRMILRIFQSGWHHVSKFIVASPVFLIGLSSWSIGFIKGCIIKEK
ncbi:glycosyltransferase [Candidatus Omnitrophota bacterium]